MGQNATVQNLSTGTDRTPAVAGGGLSITVFDQAALPEAATTALTWICLSTPSLTAQR